VKQGGAALAGVALAGGLAGVAVGFLVFGGPGPGVGGPSGGGPAATDGLASLDRKMEEMSRAVDRLSAAIDRLSAEVAVSGPAPVANPGASGGTRPDAALREERPAAVRTIESPPPPPNEEHLKELDSIDSDAQSRRKWLLLDESAALQHFGTPSRNYTVQDGVAEYWEYSRGGDKPRTLTLHRGRLIDVR